MRVPRSDCSAMSIPSNDLSGATFAMRRPQFDGWLYSVELRFAIDAMELASLVATRACPLLALLADVRAVQRSAARPSPR